MFFFNAVAQQTVLLEIDDHKIDVNEFLHIYQKNNTDENAMSFSAMMDYMDLFINFKLKVIEAEKLGLDTTKSFVTELNGYRQQLVQPYLTDKSVEEELIAEAYERMKYDVNVSHILIKVDQNASPEDTLIAYNKIQSVYNQLRKGSDFSSLAQQLSEDESVKHNNGELGWRTVFGLVYEFESQMYNTPVGSFSQPFRTRFGYHVLKVENKRPAKGRYKVAHIMIMVPRDASPEQIAEAESRLVEVLVRIKKGEDFGELAKEFSEDRQTANNGGNLGWIDVGGKMIRNFEDAVFALDHVGQVSEPLKTSYGWHIIKVLEKQEIKSFEEAKAEIKSKISNSARASRSRTVVIDRLKKEY
ncbi:MAG TPA: peptidylprolyl isomerase, partial [Bacteroidales bacterium]|nr:peptidylprolyl isomerase [Bacteroidales bacterium]